MSRFVDKTRRVVLTLENGDIVTVRERLTTAELTALKDRLFALKFDLKEGTITPRLEDVKWQTQQIELVRAYVVDWSFKDDAGEVVPCTPEAIDLLDQDTVVEIAVQIDALRKARAEQREGNA